jgi:ubiquinone/menaquinone biosynthesis C-methylase UbiE
MSFDKIVHSKPEFYQKKLDTISAAKQLLYKLLLIDRHITRQREEINRTNQQILAEQLKGRKVLEVGCGRGSFLASLQRKHGCQCYGVDISSEMIEHAKAHNPGPTYSVIDSAKLPFDDNQFDFVIFTYVLHHVDDLAKTISEAKRVGKHVIIYESCSFDIQPLKGLSNSYWKLVDGGAHYKPLAEWKRLFGQRVIAEIKGRGLVRYGMCIFEKDLPDQVLS